MAAAGKDGFSRRNFLKRAGAAAGLALLSPKALFAGEGHSVSKGSVHAVLVDLTRCIGCRACSRACVGANNLGTPDSGADVSASHREVQAFDKWSVVNRADTVADKPVWVKRQCMHCLEPACASVCPVGALSQTEEGPVIYRADRCIGCRYCMVACPFGVPKFEWHSGLFPVIGKCHFCAKTRIFKGLTPACVEACPTGALKFGKRQALLFEGRVRIRSNPKRYVSSIYGENEIGGTCWLYLSGVPFEKLGFPVNLPDSPLPSFTSEVVTRLPMVISVLAGLFGTVALHLKKERHKDSAGTHP
jgi:Fe-S-cluster-containing dehydrogenase component